MMVVAMLCLRQDRVLLVQENLPGGPWYLPAGRVEPGESLVEAVRRECREEAGAEVEVTRLLAVEQRWREGRPWVRFVFGGEVDPDRALKRLPDEHSLRACWTPTEALDQLNLRAPDLKSLVRLGVEAGLALDRVL